MIFLKEKRKKKLNEIRIPHNEQSDNNENNPSKEKKNNFRTIKYMEQGFLFPQTIVNVTFLIDTKTIKKIRKFNSSTK